MTSERRPYSRVMRVDWQKHTPVARNLRKEPTKSEAMLWQALRNRQLGGFKFGRHHRIAKFVVDLYWAEVGLVLEIDGPVHLTRQREDELRQRVIEEQGLTVLRVASEQVEQKTSLVLAKILSTCGALRSSLPLSISDGEGAEGWGRIRAPAPGTSAVHSTSP